LAVCGINYKSASVTERAPLALGREELAHAHMELMNFDNVYEAVVVSTCNRVEFYLVLKRGVLPFNVVRHFYVNFRKLDITDLEDKFFTETEIDTVEHLFNVTSGLDSMVLGETQIFGQIKDTYSSACAIKSAGKIIHRLFHQAFRTAKRVRTESDVSTGSSSVGGAAMQLLKNELKAKKDTSILFIGVNQMIHLAARSLQKSGYNNFIFANRTASKAAELANQYRGASYSLEQLENILEDSGAVVTCTGAQIPILDKVNLSPVLEKRSGEPLIIVDIAIPPDVDPPEDYKAKYKLYTLDDVDISLKSSRHRRQEAIPKARDIITTKLSEFRYWYEHAKHEPLYERVEHVLERIRREELEKIKKDLDPETAKKIENFSLHLIKALVTTNHRCKKGH